MQEWMLRLDRRDDGSGADSIGQPEVEYGHRVERDDGPDDGAYAGWRWDGRTLEAWTDRFGLMPLFYCEEEGGARVRISSSLLMLLADGADPTPNHVARGIFLRLGFYLGQETPFASIRELPEGGRLRWSADGGGIEVCGSWTKVPARAMSDDEIIDGYIEHFRRAIERREVDPEATVLPLTGGRDSRHILLELQRLGRLPRLTMTCRPYPGRDEEETTIAEAIAERCGVEHRVVEPDDTWIYYDAVRNIRMHLLSDEGTWAQMLAPHMSDGFEFSFDGIGGHIGDSKLTTPERQALYDAGELDALVDDMLDQLNTSDEVVESSGPREARDSYGREAARERVKEVLRECEGEADPLGRFYLRTRARREIALGPFASMAVVPTFYAPFLDWDLYQHLAAVPADRAADFDSLHTRVLERAFPEFSDVPFADKPDSSRMPGGVGELASSIKDLTMLAAKIDPGRVPSVMTWTLRRLADRKAGSLEGRTLPRRHLQYMIQLEAVRDAKTARQQLDWIGERVPQVAETRA